MDFKNSTIEEMNFNLINSTISVKETFVDLIQQNKISLYRLSKSILKNEADVEDAISETILKAYKSIDNLKSFDSFKPWLMKILVNECYSILKQHKKIDNLLMNLPNKKRSKNKTLKIAFIAATISTVLATTTVMAATPEVRNLVGSVISYFNNNDTRYSADKTNFEKFNKAVGVSSYDKNIKFTVNNIAVDDNFINVFLTIESKEPVSINKTGKDELFESQFSTPFLDFKVNGKTLKASNNNDNDAYFENGKKVLKSMVRFNVSQVTLPETFNLEISTNNICNVKGTWKIQTSVDKSKVMVNSKTVKPNVSKTILYSTKFKTS